MKSCGQASGFVQLLLMFYFWAPESCVMADEMVMIAEPFLQVCLIINSIMDSLFAWSPIRRSQPTRAQQTSGLIDTLVHVGTWKEAWSELHDWSTQMPTFSHRTPNFEEEWSEGLN